MEFDAPCVSVLPWEHPVRYSENLDSDGVRFNGALLTSVYKALLGRSSANFAVVGGRCTVHRRGEGTRTGGLGGAQAFTLARSGVSEGTRAFN